MFKFLLENYKIKIITVKITEYTLSIAIFN